MALLGGTETVGPTTITSNGTSGKIATQDVTMLGVEVSMSTGSAAGTLDLWAQGSIDGTNWVDAIHDLGNVYADNGTAGAVTTNTRDIVPAYALTTAAAWSAVYKHWPFNYLRFKWTNTGLSAPITIRITGK